jgi:NitT/TauT family transport system substrate-binding protein
MSAMPRPVLLCLIGLISLTLSACGGAPASSAASPGALVKLTVGYSNITGDNLALWVAKEAGIFKAQGLDVDIQYSEGGKNTMNALLAGGFQISAQGGGEVLSSVAEGSDLVVTATMAPVYPYKLMVQPEIKTAADLKGKTLAISNVGGSSDVGTRLALTKLGLNPDKDVKFITVSSHANRTAAILTGQVAGGVDDPPDTVELEKKGIHSLVDLAALKLPAAQTVITVQRSWLGSNKDTMQRFVDSLVLAFAKIRKDRKVSVEVMKKYFKSSDDHAMGVGYDFFKDEVFQPLPYPKAEQFSDAQAANGKKNPKVLSVNVDKFLDQSFVKKAEDKGLQK